ncbi:RNA polymerase-binding protein DksA [Ottowia sp.]|uniref:RNA polymerase-binding protein DksA n=1 Tax=Ottowia sp. TaxID=1898956 RepID=UPI002D131A00|nr:RNA polymerase-binding protein DksA [Ottowia sp.]HOB67274.1 RNA polymerase-binding protein DksA [Ottowia sp.]HPZ57421.1 RNA polymerase-binding protein DksA [Ottowia sp.]HQD49264.1 RNA polymerase-binding protein DksA [Ottowia sp.]
MKTAAAKSPAKPKATPAKAPVDKAAAKTVAKAAGTPAAPLKAAAKAPAPASAKTAADSASPARSPASRKSAATPKPTSALPPMPAPKNLPMPTVAAPPVPAPVKKDPKLANNWKTKDVDQLSDAEVIAMPDSEYMNDKQLAFFRLKLVRLKDDMLANADQTAENLRDDTVVVPDPADRATIEEEHALELRTRDRERKLLKKIEQSIARIDAGDYGYCDETGEPIGVPRLLARPTATLSLEAQQRRELKQKMFGD